jgi:signal transduction histidine kinase
VTSLGGALFSLQAKLIATFVVVVLVAVVLAGAVFVVIRRNEQEQQALDHVLANSPAIYSEFTRRQLRGEAPADLSQYVEEAAADYDVRVLLVDVTDFTISTDTEGDLTGQQLVLPDEVNVSAVRDIRGRAYFSWGPRDDTPGSELVLVGAVSPGPSLRVEERYWLLLAVPESTIRRAWQGLVPGLIIAALIATPVAVILGVLVSQYISGPLRRLTLASQRVAEGNYDVDVSVDRRDEVGRLSRAFSSMARRVGEAQTQMRMLVANVSHDLKTPLTSILGFSQALRDGAAGNGAEVRRMGTVIHDEASRLSARLNDLLYLSEIDAGQTLLQQDDIDLRRLLEGVIGRIAAQARERNVALDIDLAEGLSVNADGAKLERALENLLDNARKYTPAGGRIAVRSYVNPGSACIDVTNSAPDLRPGELPRLFERFYRRDRTRAETGDSAGTGLGLPIARDLIELHGGTLTAELREGRLIFTARLPQN